MNTLAEMEGHCRNENERLDDERKVWVTDMAKWQYPLPSTRGRWRKVMVTL